MVLKFYFVFQDAFEFFSNLTDQLDEILKVSFFSCSSCIVSEDCVTLVLLFVKLPVQAVVAFVFYFLIYRKQGRSSYLKRHFVACLLIKKFVRSVITGKFQRNYHFAILKPLAGLPKFILQNIEKKKVASQEL